jgi:hypothetical protein
MSDYVDVVIICLLISVGAALLAALLILIEGLVWKRRIQRQEVVTTVPPSLVDRLALLQHKNWITLPVSRIPDDPPSTVGQTVRR